MLSVEKQYELMYNDVVQAIAGRKRTIFDLTRWIVTLQGLVIGFASIRADELGIWFILAPLLIGASGLSLNASMQMELYSHRVTMAKMRSKVGGDFCDLHRDMVDKFLGLTRKRLNYWDLISGSHALIITMSTVVSTAVSIHFAVAVPAQ